MDNTINNDIIEKATIKRVAIYKAIGMLPLITTKDLWEEKNSIEPKMNCENKNVSEINDTMKDTKMPSIPNDWRDITDPKLRKKMRDKAWYEANKDKVKLQSKDWYEVNKDKKKNYIKSYRKNNKHKIKTYGKKYRKLNKDKIKSRGKLYRAVNKDEIITRIKNWQKINKDKINRRQTIYRRKKLKTDVQFKLACRLRNRIWDSLKSGSAVKDLGCTIDELKTYLESKFQTGMTWDNWSKDGWHIDHIKPLASFDLTDRKQMLEACHYTNLQPLWAKDNLAKSDN
jgi:hypothetical protein